MQEYENKKCPNCGAPATSEICPYCHNATGVDTINANMEYPLIECKEAHINFWNTIFPMIFAMGFGFFGFVFPIIFILIDRTVVVPIILFSGLFAIVGIVSFIISMKSIIRFNLIKRKGKEIEATVYGYMNDNILLNDSPTQIVKLLVTTKDGPKFILYQLGDIKHPYKINSKIKLLVYNNLFLIKNDKNNFF